MWIVILISLLSQLVGAIFLIYVMWKDGYVFKNRNGNK